MFVTLVALHVAAAVSTPLATQTAAESAEIERLVITATRTARPWLETPAAVERVDIESLTPGMRTDAAELLEGMAGLQVDTRFNFAQDTRITLRGFGARAAFGVRGVRLRLDGIPLSMPDGQAQTSSILLDEPSSVEVLRGPLAAIHGNSAGGVIDLQSSRPLPPATKPTNVSASLSAGSAKRERQHLRAVYADERQSFSGDYARFRTDGDRPFSAVKRDQWALRWYRDLGEQAELILRLDDNDAPLLQDPLALSPEQWRENPKQTAPQAATFGTRKSIRHRQQSMTLRARNLSEPSWLTDWRLSAWHGKREIEQYLAFPGTAISSSGAVIDLSRSFYGTNLSGTVQPLAATPWRLTLALDNEQQKDERLGFVNDFGNRGELRRDETGRVDSRDATLISDWQFHPRWAWVTGARLSRIDFTVADRFIVPGNPDDSGEVRYQENAWSSALNFAVRDDLSLFAGTGVGFETPTLTEMAYRNEGSGLNTELNAAKVRQHELGLKLQRSNWLAQSTVFVIDTDDDLLVDRSIDGRTTYRNAANTKRQGFELSSRFSLSDTLSWRASYTWLDASFGQSEADANSGNRLPGLARSNFFQQWQWQPISSGALQPLSLRLNHQYRSSVPVDDANSIDAPGAHLWGLAAQTEWQWGSSQLDAWLRLDNLTNKDYVGSVVVNQGNGRSFEPAPGRLWMAGITLRW
ncbi:TonB-dependent receptor [Alkalimonas delamerensis]|uniref:TonB-dependent receptor n=1 Tax=Alkalimonas delamerensis TaxID=265981 RepID=A0ABT9GRU8_9GAMM|nr:TonB-dependent receptor [Alkalimonas delamerensis]MDP4529703.1 TonB-dependent receptor [Alkalimonas delamerensis]